MSKKIQFGLFIKHYVDLLHGRISAASALREKELQLAALSSQRLLLVYQDTSFFCLSVCQAPSSSCTSVVGFLKLKLERLCNGFAAASSLVTSPKEATASPRDKPAILLRHQGIIRKATQQYGMMGSLSPHPKLRILQRSSETWQSSMQTVQQSRRQMPWLARKQLPQSISNDALGSWSNKLMPKLVLSTRDHPYPCSSTLF